MASQSPGSTCVFYVESTQAKTKLEDEEMKARQGMGPPKSPSWQSVSWGPQPPNPGWFPSLQGPEPARWWQLRGLGGLEGSPSFSPRHYSHNVTSRPSPLTRIVITAALLVPSKGTRFPATPKCVCNDCSGPFDK